MAKAKSNKSERKRAAPAKRKRTVTKAANVVDDSARVAAAAGDASSRGLRYRVDPAFAGSVPVVTLFVGDIQHREFQPAISTLQDRASLSHAANCSSAAVRLRDWSPELLIVGQRYPGEFGWQRIDRLRSASPGSILLVLDGAACEGEGRSGMHYSGIWRLYWHQAVPLLALGIKQRKAGDAAWWNTEPELARLAPAQTRGLVAETVRPALNEKGVGLVCSYDPDLAATLAEMLSLCGLQSVITRSLDLDQLQGVRLVLLDAETPEDISQLARQMGRADARQSRAQSCPSVVVVSDSVRIEDFAADNAAGAQPQFQVLGKPIDLPSLELTICSALEPDPANIL